MMISQMIMKLNDIFLYFYNKKNERLKLNKHILEVLLINNNLKEHTIKISVKGSFIVQLHNG